MDNTSRVGLSSEFWSLGLGDVFDISASNGSGTGELLDEIVKEFNKKNSSSLNQETNLPHFAIVGKPNVGKSSIYNILTNNKAIILRSPQK